MYTSLIWKQWGCWTEQSSWQWPPRYGFCALIKDLIRVSVCYNVCVCLMNYNSCYLKWIWEDKKPGQRLTQDWRPNGISIYSGPTLSLYPIMRLKYDNKYKWCIYLCMCISFYVCVWSLVSMCMCICIYLSVYVCVFVSFDY